jgi:DNA-binding CsgD family transcriptional regulator
LDADPPIGPRARAAALMARAQLSLLARDLRQATQDSFDYLRVAEEAGLDACVADARAMLGLSCMFHDQSAAREHFAIARAHLHDDARGFLDGHDHDFRRAIILGIEVGCASVGWFSDDVAEWSAAVEALSQNARTAQDAGTAATAEANLARRNAQYAKALTAAERALRPDTYDRSQLQLAETIVAEVAIDTQQPSPTLDTLVDLASRALDDGYLLGWVNLQAALLRHRATQGDLAVASEADEFVTVLMKAGASFALFQLPWLIALHQASSNIAAAEQWLLDGRALLAKAPNGRVAALLDLREASLAIGHGDAKLADQCTRAALTAADDINCPQEIVDAFEMLTIIAATYESWTEAARLHGISARSRDTLGYRLVQEPEHGRLDRALRDARAALGDGAFDAAAAEGRQLSPGDAIAYVERARGERRRPRHGWDSITPTEHQVIELAAEGLTNAQIATRLIMGQETVKTHLSSVYTKLGVSRRAQLATQLAARVHELPSTVRGR